jgi:hypothetical protein
LFWPGHATHLGSEDPWQAGKKEFGVARAKSEEGINICPLEQTGHAAHAPSELRVWLPRQNQLQEAVSLTIAPLGTWALVHATQRFRFTEEPKTIRQIFPPEQSVSVRHSEQVKEVSALQNKDGEDVQLLTFMHSLQIPWKQ